tara:strand:+ start:1993 stop:2229 length:237 start_codon:yes stop_codon:yes gene_type:complete
MCTSLCGTDGPDKALPTPPFDADFLLGASGGTGLVLFGGVDGGWGAADIGGGECSNVYGKSLNIKTTSKILDRISLKF